MAELGTAEQQQLIFLNMHWGRQYVFTAPQVAGGVWLAVARFGSGDRLEAPTSGGLLERVRAHYQANKPEDHQGGRFWAGL